MTEFYDIGLATELGDSEVAAAIVRADELNVIGNTRRRK